MKEKINRFLGSARNDITHRVSSIQYRALLPRAQLRQPSPRAQPRGLFIQPAKRFLERYEYDAYGNPTICNADFTTERDNSNYGNLFYFQGKHLDLLDNGGLELMSWPYRNYSTYLGRWLQSEKLGMIPNDDRRINPFGVHKQYKDRMNPYLAFASNPITQVDRFGLDCEIKEYKDPDRRLIVEFPLGDVEVSIETGLLSHAGFLVGSGGEIIDFGPRQYPPRLYIADRGRCPYNGTPAAGATTKTLKRRKFGFLILGFVPKPCCCATCEDIKNCIKSMCRTYDTAVPFIFPTTTCQTFVVHVKAMCCLRKGWLL